MPLAPPISTPPLLEGDSLTSDEFLRVWEQAHDVRYAELIDGIVHIPSPLSKPHGDCQVFLAGWLGHYAAATQGCFPSMGATWVMSEGQVPQPDLTLRILPEYGGQSGVAGEYHAGAPEVIVEIAVSRHARDFGAKKRLYEKMGVGEYLIVLPREKEVAGFSLTAEGFEPMEMADPEIFRSIRFPGLWLVVNALWKLDPRQMMSVLEQGLATPEHARFAEQLASQKR